MAIVVDDKFFRFLSIKKRLKLSQRQLIVDYKMDVVDNKHAF